MSNYGRTQDGHKPVPHKLHYRTQVNGYRGGSLRRKGSKSVEICGYQFHSHTTYLNPLALQTSPKRSSNLSLSSSSHSHHSALPLQIPLFILHSLTSAKDLQTLLPSTIWPFWITKDIESLPKNSREYPSPEPYCLPLDFLSILKKVSNSPKITTEYSPHYYPETKNLHRLSLK